MGISLGAVGLTKPVIDTDADGTLIWLIYHYTIAKINRRAAIAMAVLFACSSSFSVTTTVLASVNGVKVSAFAWLAMALHCAFLLASVARTAYTTRNKNKARRAVMQHLIRVYGYPDNVLISTKLRAIIQ